MTEINFTCPTLTNEICDSYHSCANVCMNPVLETDDNGERRLEEIENGNIDVYPECFLTTNDDTDHELAKDFDVSQVKCGENADLSTLFKAYPKYSLTFDADSFSNNSDSVYLDKGSGKFEKKPDRACKEIDMLQTLNFRVYPNLTGATVGEKPGIYTPDVYDRAELSDKKWYYNQDAGIISSFGVYFHMPKDTTDISALIETYYNDDANDDDAIRTLITSNGRLMEGVGSNEDFYSQVVPSGQFARSFCWAHGCDFDPSVEVVYYYDVDPKTSSLADDEDAKVAHKFGLPIMMYTDQKNVFTHEPANVCRDFNNSNSTASIMQFGIVLATAFYALLI